MACKRAGMCVVLDIKDFSAVHLFKDVGEIPKEFNRQTEEPADLFAFDPENNLGGVSDESIAIHLIRIPRFIRALPTEALRSSIEAAFIFFKAYRCLARSRVLLLFHLHSSWAFPLLVARVLNPRLYIHLKMDLNQTWFEQIKRNSDGGSHLLRLMYRIVLQCSDAISVETKLLYETLKDLKLFGVALDSRLKYFPNGVPNVATPSEGCEVPKERIFVTVGRLGTYQKNTELLIEALLRVDLKDWKFEFVGTIEPEFALWLEDKMKANPQSFCNIEFPGFVADRKMLSARLARAQVFCLSSRWEGSALSVLEAMQHECAIISTPVGMVPDLIPSGCAISIDASVDAWAETLSKAISGDYPLREMGTRGLDAVNREYSWEAILESMSICWRSKMLKAAVASKLATTPRK